MELAQEVEAGQAVYTRQALATYDFWVLGIRNRFVWRCPTPRLLDFYNRHVTVNHLDVGVGTGYYPDRCTFPRGRVRLGLMDLNPNCLEVAAERLRRYDPEIYRVNVLQPIAIDRCGYDSISMNYLLHCLPGDMDAKSVAFDHLRALLRPRGVIFGATLLHEGVRRNRVARKVMDDFNRRRIFNNRHDSLDALDRNLASRFSEYSIEVRGCAALFAARP